MKKTLLIFTLMTFGFTNAQNIFQDDFFGYVTNQQLSGQGIWTNNSSLPGGLGTSVAGGSNTSVVSFPMGYEGYGETTNALQIKPNSDGCGLAFNVVNNGDIFVAFVLNLSATQTNNNSDFFRVLSGDNFNTTFRLYATTAGDSFFIGTAKGANGNEIAFTSNSYSYNVNHLIVLKYTQSPGNSDDLVSLYINPVFLNGQPMSPTVSTNIGFDQSGNIDRMSFRQNWTNGMPTGNAGLVSVSTTWEGLTFIPLANEQFNSSNFVVKSNELKSGILSIKSNVTIQNVTLNIYDIQGRIIENKTISLTENENNITVNPIKNTGVYVVEIVSENSKFSQKIVVN